MPDLQRSRCSICYGPRAFRGPALLLRFFYKSKTIKLIVLLAYDQPRKFDTFFYKQRVTCEKNDVCATVTIDADFDRQIP